MHGVNEGGIAYSLLTDEKAHRVRRPVVVVDEAEAPRRCRACDHLTDDPRRCTECGAVA